MLGLALFVAASAESEFAVGADWIANQIEPAISAELIDPDSAHFEWPYDFTRRENGWVTCGYVNSRNRMGGYAGKAAVLVVFSPGRTPYFNIAEENSRWDGVTGMCAKWISDGLLRQRTN